jgi:hypothetical protein
MLPLFIFPESYKITVNGKGVKSIAIPYDLSTLATSYWYNNGRSLGFLYKFEISADQKVLVLWKLNREGFYQIIRTNELDNLIVQGCVILTDNSMISGLNRRNLNQNLGTVLKEKITKLVEANIKEVKLATLLKQFDQYQESGYKFVSEVFKIPLYAIRKFFQKENIRDIKQKELLLTDLFSFIKTFLKIFAEFENLYQDQLNNLLIFDHPFNELLLKDSQFRQICTKLEIHLETIFEDEQWDNYQICFLIANKGNLATILMKDLKLKTNQIRTMKAIEESNGLGAALRMENTIPFIFPLDHTEAIIELNYVDPEILTETQMVSIKNIEGLEEMEISQDESLYRLSSKKARLQEEKQLLNALKNKKEQEIEEKTQQKEEESNEEKKEAIQKEIEVKEKEEQILEEKHDITEKKIEEIEQKEKTLDVEQNKTDLIEQKEKFEAERAEKENIIAEKKTSNEEEEIRQAEIMEKALKEQDEKIKNRELELRQREEELSKELESGEFKETRDIINEITTNEGTSFELIRGMFLKDPARREINEYPKQGLLELNQALLNLKEMNPSENAEDLAYDLYYGTNKTIESLEQATEFYDTKINKATSEEVQTYYQNRKEIAEKEIDTYKQKAEQFDLVKLAMKRVGTISKVEYNGEPVEITKITLEDDLNLLYLFHNDKERNIYKEKGKLKGTRFIHQYNNALIKAIGLLSSLYYINHALYLVFEYSDEPHFAFYMKDYGLIVVNCNKGSDMFQGMDKTAKAFEISRLIAHELCHDLFSEHSQSFYQTVDDTILQFNQMRGYKAIKDEL